ncbi:MAG: hypothetical protein JWL64_1400 [Frankiales bacterium]|nr:hypothetical protein [Frankiales bacterium]
MQPYGTPVDERVAAADAAVASGDLAPMRGLVPAERWAELERRFAAVLALKDYEAADVGAGRAYIGAYVSFFKYAEGEGHGQDDPALTHAGHQH